MRSFVSEDPEHERLTMCIQRHPESVIMRKTHHKTRMEGGQLSLESYYRGTTVKTWPASR